MAYRGLLSTICEMRIILITGGNGGLGQAIAQTFLKESPDNFVWLAVHKRREQAEKLAADYSRNCSCLDLNVTQPAAWKLRPLWCGIRGIDTPG